MFTRAEKDYDTAQFTVRQRTSLAFGVDACSHAGVALLATTGIVQSNLYEFVIGADSSLPAHSVQLYRNGALVKSATVSNVVVCSQRKDLWISWAGGVLQFGKGNMVGRQIMLVWKDNSPISVSTVALSGDHGHSALWYLEDLSGMQTFFF